ncbi:hypothetical protein MKX03_034404 [Papaver bracteatum]|nr:hypothetical protein MKX03_034404 [Papaver bracteatum]
METYFLSSSVKNSKTKINLEDVLNPLYFIIFVKLIGNDMWDVDTERRYTKLVEKLHMLSSIRDEHCRSVVCAPTSAKKAEKLLKWIKMAEHHRVIALGVIMKVVTDQQDLAVQEMEHQDSLESRVSATI